MSPWFRYLPEIRRALEEAGNMDAEVMELEGLDHLFQKAQTGNITDYYVIEETLNPRALEVIRDRLLTRFSQE